VFTRITSPVFTNGGTWTTRPVSCVAGLQNTAFDDRSLATCGTSRFHTKRRLDTHDDVAIYADPSGMPVGGTYGDYIAAPISSALGPHVLSRIDDDPVDSKRIELFGLPQADNQRAVRFRFAHAGRDSWYFGIDDFGLYSIPSVPGGAPRLSVSRNVDGIVISWPADADGFTLESTPSLGSANWTPVSVGSGNSRSLPTSALQAYFRLRR
jgi:hypothetical protein